MKYLGTSAIFRSLASLGLAIVFLVPTQVVYAATITSTATGGAWNLGTTWVGGVAPLATDSVVIATTGVNTVTFNSAKVLSGSITINAGATLVTNNFALTLSGDLINNGTFTAGSSNITLNGAVNQSISGFTTTGAVSMTKTAGAATFTGNVNGGALTINGAGGTLALGAGLTHTFSGTWTRTAGTLDAGSSTLNLNGALAGAGGTFTAGTSSVNYGGAGAQTVAGVVYNNLSTIGGGVKTTGAAVTVNGNLTVGAGTTFTVGAFAITVNGNTSITGTLTHSSATGAKTYVGAVTINAGGVWNNSGNAAINLRSGLTHNGTTFTAGTGIYTFNTNNQAIGGTSAISIPSLTVTGVNLTNNGTLTVGTALSGTGTLIQGLNAILNIGNASAITGLNATANPNTVNYNRVGAQTVKGTTYHHLVTTGNGVKTTGGAVVVNGDLTVNTTSTFTVGAFATTVNGNTSVTGTLTHSSATGAKTYIGAVTINAGGVWNNSGNAAINLRSGLTHNGTTFTGGTGVYTFDTNNQAIGGTSAISIPSLTVTGVNLTNNGTLTVGTALSGTGTLIQGLNAVLNIGNASAISGLTATVNPNTVNYNRAGAQTIKATTYHHLVTAGNGVKTIGGAVVVNGNLTVNTTSTFAVGAFAITVNGNTSVTGTLTHSSAAGAKTYIGAVTINAGGVWNNSGNAAINLRSGLTHNGTTFTGGTGVYTFDTNNQAIGGTSAISIPTVTVTGVNLTNNGTLTVGTALSGTGTLIQGLNAILNIGNASAITGLTATANPNTVNYNRAGVQTVKASTYHHLTISGSGVKTIPAVIVNGVFSREGTATASAAPVFGANAALRYKGSAAQITGPEFITPFLATGGVIIDNVNGVTLAASKTINTLLTFTNGRIITGANTLTIGSTGSATGAGAGRYIFGNLVKLFPVGAAQSFTFDIGDAANYLPLALTNFNVTTLGSVAVSTSAGEHPNIATSLIDPAKDVNRFWTLTSAGGLVFTNYDVLFNFVAGDVDGGAAPGSFFVQRFFGGTWSSPTTVAPNPTNIQASGLSAMGSFAVGERARVSTTTSVNCVPNPVTLFGSTTCTATVTRAGGTNTPGGTVTWSTSDVGAFTPLNTCVLAGAGAFTTCSVIYTPSAVGPGSHTVTASYGGDANFNTSNGNQAITVNAATPVITFGAAPTPTYLGGDFTVSATTTNTDSSALTYSVLSGPCTFVSGAMFSSTGAGACVVQADGAATANFTAASQTQSVTIAAAVPLITFGAAPTPTYLGGDFTVSAATTNTDSNALTYSVVSGPCTFVSGATFSSTGAGVCVVQADGTATANFTVSSQTQSITIGIANQTINVTTSAPALATSGVIFTVAATGGASGNPVVYSATGSCTNSGAVFTTGASGTCTVHYNQAGNADFNNAVEVTEDTVVDGDAPSTSSIDLASGSPTNAAALDFTITFSEVVTGGTASNFSLITTGVVSGASITSVSAGPGATRTVTVNTGSGDGTIGLDLINGTGITDIAGNVLSAGTFTGQIYTIIKSGPPVAIGMPSLAATINGPVDFPITVTGATTVNLTNGDITLNTTGTATGTVNVTNGNTNNPTVTISGIGGNGTMSISIAAGIASDSVVPVPNTSPAAGPSATFIVDDIAPQVAANGVNTSADTGDGILSEFEVATVAVNQITVKFTEDVSLTSATDVNNYMLVNDNSNGFDDTPALTTCATDINPNGGNDSKITINSAAYNNNGGSGPFVSTLSVNNGTPLANGIYRLYVCGTTSIVDLAGNELNRIGPTLLDFRRNFSVNIQSNTTVGNGQTSVLDDIAELPATGFPVGEVTTLPPQLADLAYTSYSDLWLEIPSLSIKMNIVGVPAITDSWNVSWLGNDAGWLNGSAFPTWDGNSVITGHVWDALNQPGPFAELKKLKYGDQIKVHAFGQVYVYEIRESKLISSSNKTIAFKHEEKSWVTLITCEDYKEQARKYLYRRMVRAVLVSMISEK